MNIQELCVDFIPIFIVYLFASYPRDFVLISGSTLGKFVALCIITFYTLVNPMYGLFVCLLIVVYYQTDFVEEILNIERGEWMEQQMMEMSAVINENGKHREYASANGRTTIADLETQTDSKNKLTDANKLTEGFQANDPALYSYIPVRSYRSLTEDVLDRKDKKAELMTIFRSIPETKSKEYEESQANVVRRTFRKDNCENGRLVHRGMDVHPEMSDHVFREIKFDNEFHKCNPCDPTCSFSIIEEKIRLEAQLQAPVRSNDVMETYSKIIQDAFTQTTGTIYGYIPNLREFTTS